MQINELNNANASLNSQKNELNTLKTSLDLKINEINELNNKNASLNSKINELNNENKSLKENLQKELEEKKRRANERQENKLNNNSSGQGTIYDQFVNENPEEDDFNYDTQRRRLYTGSSRFHMQTNSDRLSLRQGPNHTRNEICQKNKAQKAKGNNNSNQKK